jgi:hypothetical protein
LSVLASCSAVCSAPKFQLLSVSKAKKLMAT